jgi:pimeloyl-ACP methyl ester carboxylesterase
VKGRTLIKHDIVVAGAKVRIYEFGPKIPTSRPTVVFTHGLGDDGLCLKAFGTDVAAAGFRVLLPDAPGHGHSQLVGEFTEYTRAASTIGVIEQLGNGPVVLGGHSMGGETALIIASQRPDLVRGLLLEEPSLQFTHISEARIRAFDRQVKDWIAGLQSSTHAERVEWVRADGPLWDESEYAPWARAKALTNIGIFDANYHWLDEEATDLVVKITAPTLLIRGAPSPHTMAVRTVKQLMRLVPQTIDVAVPGTGHCVRRDNPIAYSSAVRGFLSQFAV